jgi:hypothetical protein
MAAAEAEAIDMWSRVIGLLFWNVLKLDDGMRVRS